MPAGFAEVFALLKPLLSKHSARLKVKADTPVEYTVLSTVPSPFPQHKGEPLYFGSVRLGKAYVSYHLMPVYMAPELLKSMSPALGKRMQGKACFNFKSDPGPEMLAELGTLTDTALERWREKGWI